MRVVAYVPDLMDRSRFGGVEAEVTFVPNPADLPAEAAGSDVVVVDLGRPGVMEVVGELPPVRVIGFAAHVDTGLMERAQAAGVAETLPRSRFFSRIVELLR